LINAPEAASLFEGQLQMAQTPDHKRRNDMETTSKGTHEQGRTTGATQGAAQGSTGTTGTTAGTIGGTTGGGGAMGGSATQRAREQQSGTGGTGEMMDQARQTLSDAYDRTSRTLNASYDQAMDYGREHPGQLTLIAFGAGIAVGLLLASGFNSRSRSSRIVPPIMNALTEIAQEVFR
jgi:ElaB/YqjD/DUF883 family membrane-anchored ribosome-binding protein